MVRVGAAVPDEKIEKKINNPQGSNKTTTG